jgi:hypothetical protein
MSPSELASLLCDDPAFRGRVIADAGAVIAELGIDACTARKAVRMLNDCRWRHQHAAAFALLAAVDP